MWADRTQIQAPPLGLPLLDKSEQWEPKKNDNEDKKNLHDIDSNRLFFLMQIWLIPLMILANITA